MIRESDNKKEWNTFVKRAEHTPFLQSWEWGQFQQSLGRKVWYLVEVEDGINSAALIIRHTLPLGKSYLYCPRGPVGASMDRFFGFCQTKSSEEGSVFLRTDPLVVWNEDVVMPKSHKTISVQPSDTLVLDLSLGKEKILSKMHSKTRYNIRLSEKKGVTVSSCVGGDCDGAILDSFLKLLSQTSTRNAFGVHPDSYYKALLGEVPFVRLYTAYYEGDLVSGLLVSAFGDTVTYLHGASSNAHRNVMSPYLLQWSAIGDAIRGGYMYYDFWGIAPTDDLSHPWDGITRFKKGFGGEVLYYVGTYDIPFSRFGYGLYKIARKIKRH